MIEKTLLQNGIRVMTEHMPSVRSVAIGVWVNAGSVFESEANAGISHLIEHMLFKGTETRSASDIAAEADAIGANLNAFTAKECTCFHIKALDEDIEKAVGLLSDIVLRSTLDPEQMDRERGVVLEEIAMTEDSPEDIVFDRASEQLFMGTPIESEILGTSETVQRMERDDLVRYMDRRYTAENIVIAVAGSFDRETLIPLLESSFRDVKHGERDAAPGSARHRLICSTSFLTSAVRNPGRIDTDGVLCRSPCRTSAKYRSSSAIRFSRSKLPATAITMFSAV